jgi:ribosomal protein S18 acetylase RimI-like enzyme
MELRRFDHAQLPELMSWFPDAESARTWGGPDLRFPFEASTFRADTRVDELPTWSLQGPGGRLAGFGQYYLRAARCHLGRLAIAPGLRGRGLGAILVKELCRHGQGELGADTFSLFVMPGNRAAIALYRRLGFTEASYPEPAPAFEPYLYLVAAKLPC